MSRRWWCGRRALLWGIAIALVAGAACYPGEIEGVGEVDLVVTAYDPGASFGSFATYAMPDTIIRVDAAGTDLPPAPDLDQQVLDAVATELAALGYARLAPSSLAAPDVVVVLTVNVDEVPHWTDGFWWSYWGWFEGWSQWSPSWDAGWAPRYPWAHKYAGVRGPGTFQITMIDSDQPTSEARAIPAVWAAAIDGLFTGAEASVISRFQSLVRQAFDQSPYL